MPYKDSERKRQWEWEHREQRNTRRLSGRTVNPKAVPDPAPNQQPTSGWKVLAGLAVGLGIALVAAIAGAGVSTLGVADPIGPPGAVPD